MKKQDILFALAITHPEGAPVTPGASWETLAELRECWTGSDPVPSLSTLSAALTQYQGQEQTRTTQAQDKATKKSALFATLKTRLLNLGLDIATPADLDGKIDQLLPAAKARRESKTTTPTRLAELESQVELLTLFVVMLSRK